MDNSAMFLKTAYFVFLVVVGLAAAAGIFAEDRPMGPLDDIPRRQLEAYVEVTRVIVTNPFLHVMDIKALLAENSLTIEDYDRIDQHVKSKADLQQWVDERLTSAVTGDTGNDDGGQGKSRFHQDGEKPSPN